MFGTAGLPHILDAFLYGQRCLAKRARACLYATGFMGYFYISDLYYRLRRYHAGGANPALCADAAGALIGGNNMAVVHLANAVGGNLFLGFFISRQWRLPIILAVVAGLTLAGASAVSHDLYANVTQRRNRT
ncbi:hypothetical protein KCP78_21775 [Salmonella enterica subsp. enterica]|nr:hypothetical protein KCP78_21775 [Salmonella enterica subsp. enterica]